MGRKSLISKELILEAAMDCFINHGFEETTFQQIATRLKVSQPTIYTYFNNKMDLLGACCVNSAIKGRGFIDAKVDPKKPAMIRLQQYLSANLEFFKKSKKDAFAISSVYLFGQTNDVLKKIYHQMQKDSSDRFEALILQISYEQGLTLKNSAYLAEVIQSCLIGEIYKAVFLPSAANVKREQALFESIEVLISANLS